MSSKFDNEYFYNNSMAMDFMDKLFSLVMFDKGLDYVEDKLAFISLMSTYEGFMPDPIESAYIHETVDEAFEYYSKEGREKLIDMLACTTWTYWNGNTRECFYPLLINDEGTLTCQVFSEDGSYEYKYYKIKDLSWNYYWNTEDITRLSDNIYSNILDSKQVFGVVCEEED